LLGKRPELAEGQVRHGQPRVLHPFQSAKYLPGWLTYDNFNGFM
jgi:hypothetical protein